MTEFDIARQQLASALGAAQALRAQLNSAADAYDGACVAYGEAKARLAAASASREAEAALTAKAASEVVADILRDPQEFRVAPADGNNRKAREA